MKTMEELVIDRLVQEAIRPFQEKLESVLKDLAITKQFLVERNASLDRETKWRQKLQLQAQEAEQPLYDLFHAAEAVWKAYPSQKKELLSAMQTLSSSLMIAEKHIGTDLDEK